MKRIWYITGASKGLGLTLVKFLLEKRQQVAATSRNREQLQAAVGIPAGEQFLPLEADLTDEHSIAASLAAAHQHFGGLDVIVNNAGYGIGGAIEELSTKEITDSININLLATVQVIRYAMPYLRQQRSGHIINISSIAGLAGATGWSLYAASKAAVIGLTEVLAQDVQELGIKATVIAPGAFRTDFLTSGSLVIAANQIEEYQAVHASYRKYAEMDGQQAGDPLKAAQAMLQLVENPAPPVVLLLGADAYNRATVKVSTQLDAYEKNKDISLHTAY
ncbi:SDR family oxidoreductase [Chitinophaga solisilvae]|uniref:SDR family oxidoreductase n=1 Tax=Chitinophaga solisilvae TaxID=1233460 RepID=UPI00136E949D|nr:SDR family oxidoreductase [Chitinophaga solisilvae]